MSDLEQMDAAGIVGATREKSEGELILDLHLPQKSKDLGEGGDVLTREESLLMKSEYDDGISTKSNSSRNKSSSPVSKRSSKRKRKNRRRQEKKAAAMTSVVDGADLDGVGPPSGVNDGTGTENEFSQNSEDVNREGEETETGTESETTCHEIELDQEISSVCVEPSLTTVTSIPEEDRNDSMLQTFDLRNETNEEPEMMGESSSNYRGPTHSVETLLQIAKCKILSRILEPVHEENTLKRAYQPGRSFTMSQDLNNMQDNNSSKLVVPPCSPSSLHNIQLNSLENSVELNDPSVLQTASAETHKSGGMKNVHFHEGPPQVRTANTVPEDGPEKIFELKLDRTTEEYTVVDIPLPASRTTSSKEAVIIVENVGHTDSATSSVASEISAASLLQTNGSSSEDFAGSRCHYPSLVTVDESLEQHHYTENSNKIEKESFQETIQIFKIQNPVDTKYIGIEVDSILSKSLDKFTNLMERTAGSDDKSPNFISTEKMEVNETDKFDDVQNANTQVVGNAKKFIPQESPDSSKIYEFIEAEEFDASQDQSATMNTTFTIERTDLESVTIATFRPLSPGEIMPKAIPDMVSDTESVSAVAVVGGLSIVLEEDEDEDDISTSTSTNNVRNTAAEAPTAATVTSRPPSPSQAASTDKDNQGCSCARCVIT